MMMGAEVSSRVVDLNQIPVTLGNIVGGMLFTGLALHVTHRKRVVAANTRRRGDPGRNGRGRRWRDYRSAWT